MLTSRPRTLVIAGLLASVSAATLYHLVATQYATQSVEATLARLPNIHAGSVSIDPWNGRAVIADVSGLAGNARFRIGSLTFRVPASPFPALISPAFAAGGSARAENIDIDVGPGKVHIPSVEATGTQLTDTQLAKIFDAKDPATLVDRMKIFSADKVSIPQVTLDVAAPDITEKVVYKNTILSHVEQGKIGRYTVEATTFSITSDKMPAPIEGTLGATTSSNFDLGLYARILSESRKDPNEPLATLYDDVRIAGLEVKGSDFDVKAGELVGGQTKARPFSISVADFQNGMPKTGQKPTPAQNKRAMQFVADVYDNIELGTTKAREITGSFSHKGEPKGTLKVARVGLGGLAKAKFGEMGAEGFDLELPDAKVKFDLFTIRGFDVSSSLKALRTFTPDDPASMRGFNPRSFIPTIDGILLTNLDLDVADSKHKGNAVGGTRDKFSLGKFQIAGSNYLLAVPTILTATVEHFVFGLPADDPRMREALALGYTSADLSSKLDLAWNEAGNSLALNIFSLSGEGMGAVSLKGSFGNVTKDLFVGDAALVQAAALGISIKEVDARVENLGLLTKVIEEQAKRAGVTIEQLRASLIANTKAGIAQMFGDSPQAASITDAVVAFLKDPKSLEVDAKSARGMSAADAPLLQNPAELLKKLEIKATANQ